jgi:hypothetical protein
MIGKIYNFFPVEFNETDAKETDCIAMDDAWQWKYFAWLFWVIYSCRYLTAIAMDMDDPFIIKYEKNPNKTELKD